MRLAGASYQQIADQFGIDVSNAYRTIERALKETRQQPADEVRKMELERLDRIMLAHWKRALEGDPKSSATVMSIMERRARMLGLDAPVKTVNQNHNTNVDVESDRGRAVTVLAGILAARGAPRDLGHPDPFEPGRNGDGAHAGPLANGAPPGPAG